MAHLILFYYILLAFLGFSTVVALAIWAIKANSKTIWLLLIYYLSFAIDTSMSIFNYYLSSNVNSLFSQYFDFIVKINAVTLWAVFCSLLLFIQSVSGSLWFRISSGILIAAATLGLVVRSTSDRVLVPINQQSQSGSVDMLDIVSQLIIAHVLVTTVIIIKRIPASHLKTLIRNFLIITCIFYPGLMTDIGGIYLISFHFASLLFFVQTTALMYYLFQSFFAPHGSRKVVQEISKIQYPELRVISERELEIVNLVRNGLGNKAIAEELSISVSTVKTHLYKIYKKLKVKNRYALIRLFKK